MKIKFLSQSPKQTKKIAKILALELLKTKLKLRTGLVIGLIGQLGSGKTTFIQGFIKGLGIKRRITSPTFVLIKNYEVRIKNYKKAYHIDCYRISGPKELLKLGFKEIIRSPKTIILIEWAEKIRKILPKNTIWVEFKHAKKQNEREIAIRYQRKLSTASIAWGG